MQQPTPRGVLDTAFEALSDPTRRHVLTEVMANSPLDIEQVLGELPAAVGSESAAPAVTAHHVHVPKLADAEFIEWDRESGVIRRGPRFHDIEPVLTVLDENDGKLPGGWPC